MIRRLIIAVVIGLFASSASLIGFLSGYAVTPIHHPDAAIDIPPGASLSKIATTLKDEGVIDYPLLFVLYARLTGEGRRLKAGEYELKNGLSPKEVMRKFVAGEFKVYRITLIEGWNMKEVADYLGQGFGKSFGDEFLTACRAPEIVARLEQGATSVEGYLFPDTYLIHRPRQAGELVKMLVDEFFKRFSSPPATTASAGSEDRLRQLYGAGRLTLSPEGRGVGEGLTKHQIVTLASIIEKETGRDDERPLIASVFYNRLRRGMPLQSDPTVIYGLTNFDGNLRKADLINPHPYNTYVHPGLPPGPIANPGLGSIQAALNPAQTDFLYFVSRGDGTHEFSRDASSHARAVRKYQKR